MELSADAVMLALSLVEGGDLSPAQIGEALREVRAEQPPDQLVALQEKLADRFPTLSAAVGRAGRRTHYVPVDCRGCRASYRVRPSELTPSTCCPLCGEAIMSAGSVLFVGEQAYGGARAAEAAAEFAVAGRRSRFAHFDLLDVLGRGGAGKVYRARNRRADRPVALKLLDFQPLEPAAESFRKLRKEARAAAAVTHENVVPVYDLGVAEGVPFIEMELVEGRATDTYVREKGLLSAAEARRLCGEALRGLAAVHEAKIVHSDIKPGNILIDRSGRARLTDFGLARFLEETTTISSGGKVVGSPHFMAPEQWRGGPLTVRTDLYAMGLVLYFMLTGRLPYEQENAFALMYKHLHEPLLRPDASHYPIPDHLAQVIRRATEKRPEERFGDARSFAEALEVHSR